MDIVQKIIKTHDYILTLTHEEYLLFRHIIYCRINGGCDKPIEAEAFRKQLMSKLDGRIPEVQS
jgi:hypothetical protein